ncbi:type II toxin-antitoxin system RelE/ParE family toxin [Marixanthomonas spongiae]|uniref:Type II toxin-antitoxin system RelE/ParE family toxin n=1 Tax=Marixanthomonas spongiae TaxID=2174845 RepID=A0A2U0HZN3_9FLAO|nr:type II toxin-antitoxin system RelE/ParE family toxin [Marixanthomonas spongiae]PVW14314.1 type II toxin-antitoxin system RelE/ParE family toxin [Marixanthomonas spongiae]
MALTVFWTLFAKEKLNEIFEHYKAKANVQIAENLVDAIVDHTNNLENQPYIGRTEELLLDRPQKFRYLVFKNYKIIYWINENKNRIDIAHVFDARQDPFKIKQT